MRVAGCPAGYGYYDRPAHRVVPAVDDDGAVDWEQFLLTAALLLFGL